MAVQRRYAKQARLEDRRLDELKALGCDEASARQFLASEEVEGTGPADDTQAQPLRIWPENLGVWSCWLRLQTQWRFGPMGQLIGLRYEALDLVVRRLGGNADGDTLFGQLIEMEHAALEAQSDG